jgi:hypothetical protein
LTSANISALQYGLIRFIASVRSLVYVAIPHFLGINDDIYIPFKHLFFSLMIFSSFSKTYLFSISLNSILI